MLWSGIVVKNNDFGKNGYIEVILGQKFKSSANDRKFSKPIYELTNEDIKEIIGDDKSTFGEMSSTCKCMVLSNLGNGESFGSFAVPQIGTKGLVAEIGDKTRFGNIYYVWLGGLYGNKQYGYNVRVPNDDTNEDIEKGEKDFYESDEKNDEIKESEYINEGAYILKTKTNKIDNYNDIKNESINYNKKLPENTFILSKSKAALRHNINDYENEERKGLSQILMNNDFVIKRKIKNDDKVLEQQISMSNEKFTISISNEDDVKTVIDLSSDGNVKITTTGSLKVSAEGKMDLNSKEDMTIKTDGNVLLEATKKMQIKASGQDFGVQVDNLAQAVATLKTQGSPAAQAATPDTVGKATNVSTVVANAFEG